MGKLKRWLLRVLVGAVVFVLARAVVMAVERAGFPIVYWTAGLIGGLIDREVLAWLVPGLVGVLAILVWSYLDRKNEEPKETANVPKEEFPTLVGLFKSDFPTALKLGNEITATIQGGGKVTFQQQVFQHYESNTEFIGFYVPATPDALRLIEWLSTGFRAEYEKLRRGIKVAAKSPGDLTHSLSETLAFTGRVYIYHESPITLRQAADLVDLYRAHGLHLVLRGSDYVTQTWLQRRAAAKAIV
jgi:hypothetical protein